MSDTKVVVGQEPENKFLVKNWRDGWKWISTWALALVIFLTTVPLPEEMLSALPDEIRVKLLTGIAVIGMVMRFVKQSALIPGKK